MSSTVVTSQVEFGSRIAQGREEAGLTQAELAESVGVDRTAIAKMECGTRRVSATELVSIASALDRPVDWFVVESPLGVVSRRQDRAVGGRSRSLDSMLERISRDVSFLVREGVLPLREQTKTHRMPKEYSACEELAEQAREIMGVPRGPLTDLQAAVERLGLLAFSLGAGKSGGEAAYVSLDGWGVALVNGDLEPGRRRFNLAHELGHHLVGDAYAPEIDVGADGETERLINAFAVHLLMPRQDVTEAWKVFSGENRRLGVVAIATRFRVSWSAACGHLQNLDLISAEERKVFEQAPPRLGDVLELGERWVAELDPPSVPPDYARRVIRAYRAGKLTTERSIELLWQTIKPSDLPDRDVIPLDALRREFETLR